MDFTATRGQEFKETFDFKNADGKSIQPPAGEFKLILEHGTYAKEFTVENMGLDRQRTSVAWIISNDETNNFAYNTMYYTLYLESTELARGILRIQ